MMRMMLKRMSLKHGKSKCTVLIFFKFQKSIYYGKPEPKALHRLLGMCTCLLCVYKHVLTKRLPYNIFTVCVQCT